MDKRRRRKSKSLDFLVIRGRDGTAAKVPLLGPHRSSVPPRKYLARWSSCPKRHRVHDETNIFHSSFAPDRQRLQRANASVDARWAMAIATVQVASFRSSRTP